MGGANGSTLRRTVSDETQVFYCAAIDRIAGRSSAGSDTVGSEPMIIGIDPGSHAALSVVGPGGELLEVHDVPTVRVTKGTSRRKDGTSVPRQVHEVDGYGLGRIIDDITGRMKVSQVICELVGAMPTDAKTAAFAFGMAYGEIRGVIRANFLPLTFVSPIKWRNALKVPKGKDGSRAMAKSLWPDNSYFDRSIDEHRAESALIAEYWRRLRINGLAAA